MSSLAKMIVGEVAAFIQTHLRARDIDMVLLGRACVSIYSGNRYRSMDLDMVNLRFARPRRRTIRESMEEIGFMEKGRYFLLRDGDYTIEFPDGPLAVGEEPASEIREQNYSTGLLKLLSPTDCVKDMLAWYYHDQDLQSLEQAFLVNDYNAVDLEEIKRWSHAEGKFREFELIKPKFMEGQSLHG